MVGDLALDVVVTPERPLETATDVPGTVSLRQGGSAATTARYVALVGGRSTFVTAVGRDAIGRALVSELRQAGVTVRALRVAGARTGRIAVVVSGGERSFVADRGAADSLDADAIRPEWFAPGTALHLPAYSLLGGGLAAASRRAVEETRRRGGVVSVDVSSTGPLLAHGRRGALDLLGAAAPDLLFATAGEARALVGSALEDLLRIAPVAIVKRGSAGATVLVRRTDGDRATGDRVVRFDVATRPLPAGDPTGAGDAFDAGFLVAWLREPAPSRHSVAVLRRAALAGNAAAGRHLRSRRTELALG